MLQELRTVSKRQRDIFADKCAICRSSQSQNIVFWSKQNPHHFVEVEHHPSQIMVRGAINSEHPIGPYFFDRPGNYLNYLAMLENWFIPQLQSFGNESFV